MRLSNGSLRYPKIPVLGFWTIALLLTCSVAEANSLTARLELNTPGHRGSVQALATDPVTGRMVSGGNDKTVRVWSADGQLIETIYPPAVFDVAQGQSEQIRSAGTREGMIYAIDTYGGLTESADKPAWIAFGGQTGQTRDGQRVYIYSWHDKKILKAVKQPGMSGIIVDVGFSPDGRYLAVSSTRNGIWVWQTDDWSLSERLDKCAHRSGSLQWLSDGGLIQTCNDGRILKYDRHLNFVAAKAPVPLGLGAPNTISVNEARKLLAVGYKAASGKPPFVLVLNLIDLEEVARPSTRPNYALGSENRRNQLREEFQQVVWSQDGENLYASGNYGLMGNDARVRIRRWSSGNWDVFEDYSVGKNRIRRLAPHSLDGVAYSDLDGLVGVIDPGRTSGFQIKPSALDFRRAFIDMPMLVSHSGTKVIVPAGLGKGPLLSIDASDLSADLLDRRAIAEQGYLQPNHSGDMLKLAGWNKPCGSRIQTINQKAIGLYGFEKCSFSAAVSPTSPELAVWSTGYRLVGVSSDPKKSWQGDRPIPGGAWRLNASGDGKYIVAAAADGFVRWYHTDNGRPALSFYATAEGDWVAWTPEGYYTATPNGERLLAWRIREGNDLADRVVPVDRLRQRYRNPSAVRAALSGFDGSLVARGNGGPELPQAMDLPPEVTLLSVTQAGEDPGKVLVRYTVDTGATTNQPIQLTVRADQRIVQTPTTLQSRGADDVREIVVDLLPGEENVTLIARVGDRVSSPRGRKIEFEPAERVAKSKGDLYAVLIGVSAYDPDQFTPLNYTDDDAANIADILVAQVAAGHFNAAHIALLDGKNHGRFGGLTTSTEPTDVNIKRALAKLAKSVGASDTAVVFFAGHGMQKSFGDSAKDIAYYLVPENATADDIELTGIEPGVLLSSIGRSKAARKLVFLDACHSGSPDFKDIVQKFSDDESGLFVFSSARFNELSYEDANLKNGAYTEALLELFGSPPPERAKFQDPEDKMSALEIHIYTKDRVKQLTGKRQVPIFFSPVPMEIEDVFAFSNGDK